MVKNFGRKMRSNIVVKLSLLSYEKSKERSKKKEDRKTRVLEKAITFLSHVLSSQPTNSSGDLPKQLDHTLDSVDKSFKTLEEAAHIKVVKEFED